ncbi:hypothetical protein [Streptomyces sp. NPDC018693]|uniref:hypothetical protein n=1 Tax=unclassified Streptomyces TaxID=2593676 RepID=UPI0037934B8E
MGSLISAVRDEVEAARFLAGTGDFDPDRADHVEDVSSAVLGGRRRRLLLPR